MVPATEIRTYYDQPVVREPVWTWEVPAYFFAGGLAGAASPLALAARLTDDHELARVLETAAAAAAAVSPILLVSDLGRPDRFYNMLRVFKPTSPMNVGSWVLTAYAPAAVGVVLLDRLGRFDRLRTTARLVAAALGPVLATYTAVLLADTAIPVWHEARRELPAVFAAGALASAGAVGVLASPPDVAGPARRALTIGAAAEVVAVAAMERNLGPLASPYREGRAGRLGRAARFAIGAGAMVAATAGRSRRVAAVAGGTAVLAGAACERFAMFAAGHQSARDPRATVGPQRARLA